MSEQPDFQKIVEWARLTMREINEITAQIDPLGDADEWNNHNLRDLRNALTKITAALVHVEAAAYNYEICTCGECIGYPEANHGQST